MRMRRLLDVDMLEGPIVKNLMLFSIPLMATNILQFLYNAADMVVLGQFAGINALAAVGATGSTYNLIINVFIGLATGVGVVVAQRVGADDRRSLSDTVHTTAAIGIIIGVFVGVLGLVLSPVILKAIGTPSEVMREAVLYLRIMSMGIPALIVYNFGAAVLRSVGDTRRPFYYLAFSGALNVVLNLFFVLVIKMSVDGVGLATIISQYVSAAFVWSHLMRTGECYYFRIKETRIVKEPLLNIVRIGIPTGMQSAMFSLANLLIQSAINEFGTEHIAASTASSNVENICYTSILAVGQAVLVFVGQNVGAGQIKRVKSIYFKSLLVTLTVGLFVGGICSLFARQLIGIFTDKAGVIEIAIQRFYVIAPFYFICGFYECAVGAVRGTGYSLFPMLGALFGICIFRAIWIYTVFAWAPSFTVLMAVFPVSWALTFAIESVLFAVYYQKLKKRQLQTPT